MVVLLELVCWLLWVEDVTDAPVGVCDDSGKVVVVVSVVVLAVVEVAIALSATVKLPSAVDKLEDIMSVENTDAVFADSPGVDRVGTPPDASVDTGSFLNG